MDETPEDDNDITLSSYDEVFIYPGNLNSIVNSAINRIKKSKPIATANKIKAHGAPSRVRTQPRLVKLIQALPLRQQLAFPTFLKDIAGPSHKGRANTWRAKAQEIASTSTGPSVSKEPTDQASNARKGLVLGLQNPENKCSSKTANVP